MKIKAKNVMPLDVLTISNLRKVEVMLVCTGPSQVWDHDPPEERTVICSERPDLDEVMSVWLFDPEEEVEVTREG